MCIEEKKLFITVFHLFIFSNELVLSLDTLQGRQIYQAYNCFFYTIINQFYLHEYKINELTQMLLPNEWSLKKVQNN